MNINVIHSFISNEGIVSKMLTKKGLLSISLLNIQKSIFISPIGYGIIIIILLVIIWAIRRKQSQRDSLIQENTNINVGNEAIDMLHMNRSGVNQTSHNNDIQSSLMDDKELVAIITAALMAYMGEEEVTDGLVIRSIRKVNRRKQTNELNIY